MSSTEFNKDSARRIAEEKEFDVERMLVCIGCGRTVVRSRPLFNPGEKDRIFCTCEEVGLPMVTVEDGGD